MDPAGARVVVNGGARAFTVTRPGTPLLFALMSQTLLVPSACGGRASCGQCRVRVLSGAGPHNEKETALLSEGDRASGIHLACQVIVSGDVEVVIPDSALHARPYLAQVAAIRDLTADLREIELDLLRPAELHFRPGQYVQFLLPEDAPDASPVYRAYSIASPPSSPRRITLLFGRVEGGVTTTYVFEKLRIGDQVRVNGPFGEFYVRNGSRELLFVAGGTGMAPIRSMLIDLAENGDGREATLFCAAKVKSGLVYLDELAALGARLPGLRIVPTLAQPLPGDAWEGERGGVAALLDRSLTDLSHHEAYLCGSPGMIDASISVLRSKGLPEDRIHVDKFS
jgi:Na+-transporting NADH:ubiquinone oxidoreductase subunit F